MVTEYTTQREQLITVCFACFCPQPLTVRISTKEELGAPYHQPVPIKESI